MDAQGHAMQLAADFPGAGAEGQAKEFLLRSRREGPGQNVLQDEPAQDYSSADWLEPGGIESTSVDGRMFPRWVG
jgi:hypothetical protein